VTIITSYDTYVARRFPTRRNEQTTTAEKAVVEAAAKAANAAIKAAEAQATERTVRPFKSKRKRNTWQNQRQRRSGKTRRTESLWLLYLLVKSFDCVKDNCQRATDEATKQFCSYRLQKRTADVVLTCVHQLYLKKLLPEEKNLTGVGVNYGENQEDVSTFQGN
jgi:hypothetical protein